jgi:PKD repeat protein
MGTTTATVTDTTVVPVDTSALILPTYLLPLITNLDPTDTFVETSTVCAAAQVSQADFTAVPTAGTVPLVVQFTDQSTGTVTDWLWDFGDGNTSTEQSPSHLYDQANEYTVSLTTDGPDGVDMEIKPNYIDAQHFANFTGAPISGTAPLTVSFLDMSTGNPYEWFWDFGEGSTRVKQNPQNVYYDLGYYTVSLTATNADGQDTLTKTDYIYVHTYGAPHINRLNPESPKPKQLVNIIGYNFGDTPDDVIVHFGPKTYDQTSSRIKLWTNKKITFRVPFYSCAWFNGEPTRTRKLWITVNGVDSNIFKFEVSKPDTCP